MANTLKFGNGNWATKEGSTLAYNDENGNFKPLPFDFTRASSATVVNKDGLIEEVGSGQPRIDYKDDSKGALLLEPSRTNSVTYSNDLSQTVYNGDLRTGSVYGELGFNGENDAWRYTKDSSTSSGLINLAFSGTYTISFFIKKEANKGIKIYNFGDTSQYSTINIENGTYIEGVNAVKIEKFSNDWFRVSQTLTVSNGKWYFYLTDGIGNQIATSVTLQNFQIEQGSYATSYIPTSGSAVTRIADACNQTPPDGVIGQSEGVLYAELFFDTRDSSSLISINDGSTSNYVYLGYSSSSNVIRAVISPSGANLLGNDIQVNTPYKIAVKYKQNDFALWVNGLEVDSENSGSTPLNLSVLEYSLADLLPFYGSIKDVRIYNTALTDQELAALTTI